MKDLDSEKTLSVSIIATYLKISSVAINKRLLRLIKLNIIERVPFIFTQIIAYVSLAMFCDNDDQPEEGTIEQLCKRKNPCKENF